MTVYFSLADSIFGSEQLFWTRKQKHRSVQIGVPQEIPAQSIIVVRRLVRICHHLDASLVLDVWFGTIVLDRYSSGSLPVRIWYLFWTLCAPRAGA